MKESPNNIKKEINEILDLFARAHLQLASEYAKKYNKMMSEFVREVELIANYDLGPSPDVKKILRNG